MMGQQDGGNGNNVFDESKAQQTSTMEPDTGNGGPIGQDDPGLHLEFPAWELHEIQTSESVEQLHKVLSAERRPIIKQAMAATIARRMKRSTAIGGDYSDYHNLATEATRMNHYVLAQIVLEAAQRRSRGPIHPTLAGDYIQALRGRGEAEKAVMYGIEYWRNAGTSSFVYDWRTPVHLSRAIIEIDPSLSGDVPDSYEVSLIPGFPVQAVTPQWFDVTVFVLETTTGCQPQHLRAWSELADLHDRQGRWDAAISALRKAIVVNPLSQQLHFSLGEKLLAHLGDIPEMERRTQIEGAVACLQRALLSDYQDGYQPDTNASAILLRLAQAYEAAALIVEDKPAMSKALGIYDAVGQGAHDDDTQTLANYANTRMRLLRAWYETVGSIGQS